MPSVRAGHSAWFFTHRRHVMRCRVVLHLAGLSRGLRFVLVFLLRLCLVGRLGWLRPMFVCGCPWFLRLLRLRRIVLVLMLGRGLLLRSRGFGRRRSWMIVGSFTGRVSVRCRF
jgi:hypothetical protein